MGRPPAASRDKAKEADRRDRGYATQARPLGKIARALRSRPRPLLTPVLQLLRPSRARDGTQSREIVGRHLIRSKILDLPKVRVRHSCPEGAVREQPLDGS